MAWIDDRIWCHRKFTDISGDAGWTWTKAVAYSAGMGLGGLLTRGQQTLVGATPKIRRELVTAGLWNELDDGAIAINDWDEHNGKRDARRQRERQRKHDARTSGRWNESDRTPPQTPDGAKDGAQSGARPRAAPSPAPRAAPARVDGSEGSERTTRAVTAPRPDARTDSNEQPSGFAIKQPTLRSFP